ncbi:MAG TPA: hypothetical protein VF875_17560 [Anaeromyxobacter sp.]
MDEVRLKIYWDGDAPGLAEHRLSISAFGPALRALLLAARRIASSIVKDALENSEYGARGGRLADEAKRLDLEVVALEGHSLEPTLALRMHAVPKGETAPLFEHLPVATAERLLDFVEAESKGKLASFAVRKYLRALPGGVTVQRYEASRNGTVLRRVDIGAVALPVEPARPPYLMQLEGQVVGVGFEAQRPEIRILMGTKRYTCSATLRQVDRAIELRGKMVRALVLSGAESRLLWIRPADDLGPLADPRKREDYAFQAWADTLARLAK